jgi:penicillin amidase
VFASRDGDIGFKTVGRVPVRQAGLCHTPTRDPWLGFVEFDNLPELLNPPGGIIVNANNPITDNDFSPLLTTLWNPGYRARRMFNWVAAKQGLTMGDLARLQQDALNLHAQDLLPELLSVAGLNASESEVVRVLSAWDFRDDATSQASLLWHRLFDALAKNLYGPEFRRFMPFFEHKNIATTRLLKRAIAGDETPWVKDRLVLAAMVRDAMGTAYRAVEGNNRAWGQHHRLGFKHLLSSALGRLAKFVDIPPRQRHGSGVTVALNAGYPNVTDGAVWSMVTGFSTTHSSSRSLLLPGQSGDFRSRWYADQFHRSSCAAAHLITSRELASGVQETRTPPFADPFKEVFCG